MRSLFDICALSAALNFRHISFGNAVLGGGESIQARVGPYCANLIVSYFSKAMGLASRGFGFHDFSKDAFWRLPSFGPHVGHVILLGAPSKMPVVDAAWIITRMHRDPSIRVTMPRQNQGDMRSLYVFPAEAKIAIPPMVCANPVPTFTGREIARYARQRRRVGEANKVFYQGISHVVSPYVRGQGRALLTQRFRPAFLSRIRLFPQVKAVA